jgi:antitoxin HicB
MVKSINYYLGLPYTVIMRADQEGDFVARVDELPGCSTHGKTQAEALEALEETKRLWITDCLENHDPVPEPAIKVGLPSGKWLQRVPRSLHRKLIQQAKREGVSLNQLVTSVLSEAVGAKQGGQPQESGSMPLKDLWAVGCLHKGDLERYEHSWSIREHQGTAIRRPEALRLLSCKSRRRKPGTIRLKRFTDDKEITHQSR